MSSQLTIDAFGRVVIPKRFRDQLRLDAGDRLEIGAEGDQIFLKPVRQKAPLGKEHGIWVYHQGSGKPVDTDSLLSKLRQERIDDLIR